MSTDHLLITERTNLINPVEAVGTMPGAYSPLFVLPALSPVYRIQALYNVRFGNVINFG